MSKAILFWRRAFFIRGIPVFKKNGLCWPSLKLFWVNLARAIMSSRPMEGTKMATK